MAALEIVGRDEELAVVAGFLADKDSLPRVLLIEGEPGIGKTTVWRHVIEEGRSAGFRVLTTRPGRSDAQLAFAGVSDLVEGSLDDLLPALPPPQARALRVALLLDDPGSGQPTRARSRRRFSDRCATSRVRDRCSSQSTTSNGSTLPRWPHWDLRCAACPTSRSRSASQCARPRLRFRSSPASTKRGRLG